MKYLDQYFLLRGKEEEQNYLQVQTEGHRTFFGSEVSMEAPSLCLRIGERGTRADQYLCGQ